jgi:hypothetical protein
MSQSGHDRHFWSGDRCQLCLQSRPEKRTWLRLQCASRSTTPKKPCEFAILGVASNLYSVCLVTGLEGACRRLCERRGPATSPSFPPSEWVGRVARDQRYANHRALKRQVVHHAPIARSKQLLPPRLLVVDNVPLLLKSPTPCSPFLPSAHSGDRTEKATMNRYAWTFVAYIAFCFLAPFYMLSRGPITPDRLALLWAIVAALGAFVNLWLAYGAGRWILRKLRRSRP